MKFSAPRSSWSPQRPQFLVASNTRSIHAALSVSLIAFLRLEPGERIAPEELERAEAAQRVRAGEGDVLLVATGRDARRAAKGPWDPNGVGLAGLDPRCIPWLHERRVAVLGSDGVSDALPGAGIAGWPIPVHQCCLVGMGVHLLDNHALGELARACAARERSEFLLAVAPLRVPGGTGSPVNPIALF